MRVCSFCNKSLALRVTRHLNADFLSSLAPMVEINSHHDPPRSVGHHAAIPIRKHSINPVPSLGKVSSSIDSLLKVLISCLTGYSSHISACDELVMSDDLKIFQSNCTY